MITEVADQPRVLGTPSVGLTPYEVVLQHYSLPEEINGEPLVVHPLQIDAINELAVNPNSGLWLDTGTGKTLVETMIALYRKLTQNVETTVILMPPILVVQWGKWLKRITLAGTKIPALSITEYRGIPAQRKKLRLDVDFVLAGVQIFKRDYDRFVNHFVDRRYHVALDEATFVGNVETDNHAKVYDFAIGMPQDLLSGTPMNNPMDTYGLLKFTAPGSYRHKKHFENMHVEERDFFDNPVKFQNLELLAENLARHSKRVLFEDMYPNAEAPLFVRMPYDLDPAHYKLYTRLAEDQLLALPDGGKIDATTASKLMHALGQIIVNYGHFSGKPENISTTIDLIENRINEIGGKLVVFANYRMSIALMVDQLKKYKAVSVNGDVTPKQKQRAISQFIDDPKCQLIVVHPKSAGYGVDGLQHVCHHAMFAEPVQQHRDFHQCVARLKRTGQRKRVVVGLPIAEGTLQVRQFNALLQNDSLVGQVIRNATDLRSAIFGK